MEFTIGMSVRYIGQIARYFRKVGMVVGFYPNGHIEVEFPGEMPVKCAAVNLEQADPDLALAKAAANFADSLAALEATRDAVECLRQARNLLVKAGANRAADKVRVAMKSAEGAVRHAEGKASRGYYQPTTAVGDGEPPMPRKR